MGRSAAPATTAGSGATAATTAADAASTAGSTTTAASTCTAAGRPAATSSTAAGIGASLDGDGNQHGLHGGPADVHGTGCDGRRRPGDNGSGGQWAITSATAANGPETWDRTRHDAWAGYATWGNAWYSWHAGGPSWGHGRVSLFPASAVCPASNARSSRAASCTRRWRTDGHGPALAGSPAADAGAAVPVRAGAGRDAQVPVTQPLGGPHRCRCCC